MSVNFGKEIVIASNNEGKIKEFQDILTEYKIIPIKQEGINIEIEENEPTFIENAIKKAVTISKKLDGRACIADDSGIEIKYLNGFPGVFTKRWKTGTDRQRNLEIINKLRGAPKERRNVCFISAVALAYGKNIFTGEAKIDGFIAEAPRGENGFGFDEIFELDSGKTLAELSLEEKNKISARKEAILKLYSNLKGKNDRDIYKNS